MKLTDRALIPVNSLNRGVLPITPPCSGRCEDGSSVKGVQFPDRLYLDLPNPFAEYIELLSQLLESSRGVHAYPETHSQDFFLLGIQGAEHPFRSAS